MSNQLKEYTGTGASGGNSTDGNNIPSPRPFVDDEAELDNYLENLQLKNRLTEINEMEKFFLDLANQSNEGFVSEYGEIERWKSGVDREKISQEIIKAPRS